MTRQLLLPIALLMVLIGAPLLFALPNPLGHQWLRELHDAGHTALFFAVQLLILEVWSHWSKHHNSQAHNAWLWLGSTGASLMLGAAIELLQHFVDRTPSWADYGRNCLGIIAACALFYGIKHTTKIKLRLLCAGVIGIAFSVALAPVAPWLYATLLNRAHFPTLMDAETPATRKHVNALRGASLKYVKAPLEWSANPSTTIALQLTGKNPLEGLSIHSPHPNWLGYTHLVFDAFVPLQPLPKQTLPLKFGLNFYSLIGKTKKLQVEVFHIKPGVNTIKVPLKHSATLNPALITSAAWHALNVQQPTTIYIDNIRVE